MRKMPRPTDTMKTPIAVLAALACLAIHPSIRGQAAAPPASAPREAASVPMCSADDLSLDTDDENGNFNATSHSGVLVVLRNVSSRACRVSPVAHVEFSDKSGILKARATTPGFGAQPNGMVFGHGPVVLPVVVAAGAELTSSLRWVSAEVFDRNTCITPTTLSVIIQGSKQSTPLQAHLCGDADHGGITFEQSRFAPDPVYTPTPSKQ